MPLDGDLEYLLGFVVFQEFGCHRQHLLIGDADEIFLFPLVRVDSELQHVAEKILGCRETLLGFVEQPIQPQAERINLQQEFIKRGLRSGESARSLASTTLPGKYWQNSTRC